MTPDVFAVIGIALVFYAMGYISGAWEVASRSRTPDIPSPKVAPPKPRR